MVAFYTFPCGVLGIGQEGENIVSIQPVQTPGDQAGTSTRLTDQMAQQLHEYFQGRRQDFQVPYLLKGTPFQKRVWAALCQIPYGQTRSYLDIARSIGNPRGCRAVGMANHKNPLMILVPCHRVIGADGSLGGYAGGVETKRFLLDLERRYNL